MQKFHKGDKVKVLNPGHAIWITKEGYKEFSKEVEKENREFEIAIFWGEEVKIDINDCKGEDKPKNIVGENENYWIVDISPEIVGQEGIIAGSYADLSELNHWGPPRDEQTENKYHIDGIKGKCAWYFENQIESC